MKFRILLVAFFVVVQYNYSQTYKFGKVSKEELEQKYYPLDSSANAAILYKKRRTVFDFSQNEGWTLKTKVHERIKLYNKDGFDWATKKIDLYEGSAGNETVSIKAYTFNLEGNKIEKIKLKGNEVFDEQISERWDSKKFTMPNIKEGSVIDIEYSIRSPYYSNIDDMVLQYKIPLKHVDSEIRIPEYFRFKYLPNFYYPVSINKTTKGRRFNFTEVTKQTNGSGLRSGISSQTSTEDIKETFYNCVQKDIPALREEPYTNNIDNYRSKVSFELTAYTPTYGSHQYFNNTWEDVTKSIYKSANFGGQLEKEGYLSNDVANVAAGTSSNSEKIVKAFSFIKQKIKWDGNYGKYTREGVRKAYKEGSGNVAEINLTLVTLLRALGLKANPVLLSTRDHGIPLYPTTEGFNYVIAAVELPNGLVLMDASEPFSIPNLLPIRDLNWQGRLVRKDGSSRSINLFPKKHSSESTYMNLKIEDEILQGTIRSSVNNLLALNYRNSKSSKSEDQIIAEIEEKHDIEILDFRLNDMKELGKPVTKIYKFESEESFDMVGDKIYLTPLLFHTTLENPFKLDERKFPVDFGTPLIEKLTVSIEIPEGYTVEFLPEKGALGLPDGMGVFRYMTSQKENKIHVLSSIQLNTPVVAPQHYQSLKTFYDEIIKKQGEKIILSKI